MSSSRLLLPRRRAPALALALALAWALLLAQGLGLAHGVRHAPGLAAAVALSGPADDPPAAAAQDDHEAGDAECRLLDQLAHADALLVPPLVLPPRPPAAALAAPAPLVHAAAFATAYQARAPPRG